MYVSIDPDGQLDVTAVRPVEGIVIEVDDPMSWPEFSIDEMRLDEYFDVVGTFLSGEEEQRLAQETGMPVSPSVPPPDPWLLAIAVLMWEAIVQGITWDSCKTMIQSAVNYLQRKGVAPTETTAHQTERSVHVYWASYIELSRLAKLFFRLEFEYKSRAEHECQDLVPLRKTKNRKGKNR